MCGANKMKYYIIDKFGTISGTNFITSDDEKDCESGYITILDVDNSMECIEGEWFHVYIR